jgi:hypothetical protein
MFVVPARTHGSGFRAVTVARGLTSRCLGRISPATVQLMSEYRAKIHSIHFGMSMKVSGRIRLDTRLATRLRQWLLSRPYEVPGSGSMQNLPRSANAPPPSEEDAIIVRRQLQPIPGRVCAVSYCTQAACSV